MKRDSFELRCDRIFGGTSEPIEAVARRALNDPERPIVWEGDASTFQFTYVSPNAETLLGHSVESWLKLGFWAESVVHPDDRDEAVAYCALATGKRADHKFEYRAMRADGQHVWLLDVVRVVVGQRGVAERLRGLMFDITAERAALGASSAIEPARFTPTLAELHRLAI